MTGQGTIKKRRARPENSNGEKQAMTNPSPTTRTVMLQDIPEWRRDKKYILTGYRPLEADYLQVIKSLTFLHNETCNVYTHLIGAMLLPLFAIAILRTIHRPQYINVTRTDFIIFSVFFYSAKSCLIFSAVYHLIGSHSRQVEQFWHRMDLLGIVIVTVGTFIPGIYYIFNCEPFLQKTHWTIVCYPGHSATLLAIRSLRSMLTGSLGYSLRICHRGSHLHPQVQDVAMAKGQGRRIRCTRCVRFYPLVSRREALWTRLHARVFGHEMVPCRTPSVWRRLRPLCSTNILISLPLKSRL